MGISQHIYPVSDQELVAFQHDSVTLDAWLPEPHGSRDWTGDCRGDGGSHRTALSKRLAADGSPSGRGSGAHARAAAVMDVGLPRSPLILPKNPAASRGWRSWSFLRAVRGSVNSVQWVRTALHNVRSCAVPLSSNRTRRAFHRFMVGVGLVGVWPHAGLAQAVLKGRIVASQSRHPLAGADVIIEDLKRVSTTTDSGEFRLADIPLGVHALRVRRIGFKSAITSLRIEAADSLVVEIEMEAWVPELETIYVTAPRQHSGRLQEFERRREHGLGTFIADSVLRESDDKRLADLLRERGLRVEARGFREYVLATSGCRMQIVVDGIRIRDFDLARYPVSDLGGIEIYRRAAEAPIEFTATGFTCGLVLIWTRDH